MWWLKHHLGLLKLAYLYSSEKWSKVGDVVSSSTGSNDKKVEYEGKMYDYVFDVDIEEGKPALKLPVNVTDNAYGIADKFMAKHDLPPSYRDQIVNFILQNTSGMTLNVESKQQPTATVSVDTSIPQDLIVLPMKQYLYIKNYNADSIFNGIVKFNSEEHTFTDEDIAQIGTALQDVDQNWEILYSYSTIMREQWKNKIPAFDLLRLIVDKLEDSTDISDFIEEGLGNENITIVMLTVRILVNSFKNPKWGIDLMSANKVYESIFETIDTNFANATLKQSQNLALSVATLILNYSVLILHDKERNINIAPVVIEALNTKYAPLEEYQDSEEVAYRLIIAFGNLTLVQPSLKQFSNSISWVVAIKRKYATIARFKDVFADLNR